MRVVLREPIVIEGREKAHEVVQQISVGRMLAQHLDLLAMKTRHLVRHEAPEVEQMDRIGVGGRQVRQADCVERRILHAPEHIAPCFVERIDAFVATAQPA